MLRMVPVGIVAVAVRMLRLVVERRAAAVVVRTVLAATAAELGCRLAESG